MRLAFALAKKGLNNTGSNPMVGAVLVKNGLIIGKGYHVEFGGLHAEANAIKDAERKGFSVKNAKLFVTLEPCLMCCGALIHARFEKVIFSTLDKKSGAVISNGNLLEANFVNHYVKFEQGPLQEESSALLKEFFKIKRSKV